MWARCTFAVRGEMNRRCPISALVSPCAARRATSRSALVGRKATEGLERGRDTDMLADLIPKPQRLVIRCLCLIAIILQPGELAPAMERLGKNVVGSAVGGKVERLVAAGAGGAKIPFDLMQLAHVYKYIGS